MTGVSAEVTGFASHEYQYGFSTHLDTDTIPKGLSEDVIRLIAAKKGEPDWLVDWRCGIQLGRPCMFRAFGWCQGPILSTNPEGGLTPDGDDLEARVLAYGSAAVVISLRAMANALGHLEDLLLVIENHTPAGRPPDYSDVPELYQARDAVIHSCRPGSDRAGRRCSARSLLSLVASPAGRCRLGDGRAPGRGPACVEPGCQTGLSNRAIAPSLLWPKCDRKASQSAVLAS